METQGTYKNQNNLERNELADILPGVKANA